MNNLVNKLCLELAAVNEVWSIDTVVYLDKNCYLIVVSSYC